MIKTNKNIKWEKTDLKKKDGLMIASDTLHSF